MLLFWPFLFMAFWETAGKTRLSLHGSIILCTKGYINSCCTFCSLPVVKFHGNPGDTIQCRLRERIQGSLPLSLKLSVQVTLTSLTSVKLSLSSGFVIKFQWIPPTHCYYCRKCLPEAHQTHLFAGLCIIGQPNPKGFTLLLFSRIPVYRND